MYDGLTMVGRNEILNINELLIKFFPDPIEESEEAILEGNEFILWLKTQTRRHDDIGKLSRLITEDVMKGHFPKKVGKYQIMMHLISHNMSKEGREAFISAWSEFEKKRKLISKK